MYLEKVSYRRLQNLCNNCCPKFHILEAKAVWWLAQYIHDCSDPVVIAADYNYYVHNIIMCMAEDNIMLDGAWGFWFCIIEH